MTASGSERFSSAFSLLLLFDVEKRKEKTDIQEITKNSFSYSMLFEDS